jgi:hypothetical protein
MMASHVAEQLAFRMSSYNGFATRAKSHLRPHLLTPS